MRAPSACVSTCSAWVTMATGTRQTFGSRATAPSCEARVASSACNSKVPTGPSGAMRSARLATVHARGGRVHGPTRLRKRVWAFTALRALTCVPRRRPEARRCTLAGGHHLRVYVGLHLRACFLVPACAPSFIVVAVTRRLPPPLTDSTAANPPSTFSITGSRIERQPPSAKRQPARAAVRRSGTPN